MMNLDFTLHSVLGSAKVDEPKAGTLTMTAASLDTLKVFAP